jgi:hypothetical protein
VLQAKAQTKMVGNHSPPKQAVWVLLCALILPLLGLWSQCSRG